MTKPRLTLCVIVRDEERFLDGCLDSVRGIVDAMVVVDTGSRDATLAIAREHDAEVVPHFWRDDFAAARNAGLAQIPRGWVLMLDADERLAPEAGPALREALLAMDRSGIDLGLLPLHDASRLDAEASDVVAGRARQGELVWLPRVLRHTGGLAYRGCVHESVGSWAAGRKACAVEAPIVHYGACPELRRSRDKDRRNRELLERRVAAEPGDSIARAYLAREIERAGDVEGARAEALRAWEALVAARESGDADPEVVLPATLHAQACLDAGDAAAAESVLARAIGWSGDDPHPNLVFLTGLAAEYRALAAPDRTDALAAAARAYEACLAQEEAPILGECMPGVRGWQSRVRLGTVRLMQDRGDAALREFAAALAEVPDDPAARLGEAEALWRAGRSGEARARLDALDLPAPDGWALRAAMAGAEGDAPAAAAARQAAGRSLRTQGFVAPHRRAWLGAAAADGPELSVVVATYQRRETLAACLAALDAQDVEPARFEVVVVNDGSTDGTTELLADCRLRCDLRVVEQENRGLAAARNAGLEVARGALVLLINDDTLAEPGLVAAHLAAHARVAPERVAVLGTFEQPAEALRRPLMRLLESNDMVFCYAGMRPGARYDWTRFWTCNVSVSREAIALAGGFDEAFRHYGAEDTDLGLRLGLGVVYDTSARAWHRHVLEPADLEQRTRTVARAWVRLLRKHPVALEHRDWRWVKELSRQDCLDFAAARALHADFWRLAVEELAALDLRDVGQSRGSSGVESVLDALAAPLGELHRLWWHEGFADGLAEHGLESFGEIDAEAPARRGWLAWPRYGAAEEGTGELDRLLAEFGARLANRADAQLCLLHDARWDGSSEEALRALEAAYARQLPDAELDVLFLAEPLDAAGFESLRTGVVGVLELPSAAQDERRALFERLGLPRCADGATLESALGR